MNEKHVIVCFLYVQTKRSRLHVLHLARTPTAMVTWPVQPIGMQSWADEQTANSNAGIGNRGQGGRKSQREHFIFPPPDGRQRV